MSDIATFSSASYTPDLLLVDGDEYQSRQVTLVSGQNLLRGAVLGKITASGKYTLSAAAASDGSQVPDLILAEDCNATAGDTAAVAYIEGDFNGSAVILGAGHTVASIRDGLQDRRGILLLDVQAA